MSLLIKVELEIGSVDLSGKNEVSSIFFDSSSTAHLRDDVEWSTEVETILFLYLLLHWVLFFSVDDTPLLVSGIDLLCGSNILAFLAFIVVDLHDLALDIDEQVCSESEKLVPFTVSSTDVDLVVV